MNGNQWVTWVILHTLNKKILVGSYYRSPNKYKTNDNDKPHYADPNLINEEIKQIKNKYKFDSILISGDFNIHSKIWDVYCGKNSISNYDPFCVHSYC